MKVVVFLVKILGSAAALLMGLISVMHRQAMKKLDDVVKSNHEIREEMAGNKIRLDYGEKEFERHGELIKENKDKIHKVQGSLLMLKEYTVSHKQLEKILESR